MYTTFKANYTYWHILSNCKITALTLSTLMYNIYLLYIYVIFTILKSVTPQQISSQSKIKLKSGYNVFSHNKFLENIQNRILI